MSYRLHYFPIRGRAEQIRILLHVAGAPFEDVRIRREAFVEMKKQGPTVLMFGSLPMLEDGDLRLAQGPAIMSYVAKKEGLAPKDIVLGARADAICMGAEDLRTKYFGLLGGEDEAKKQKAFGEGDWVNRWLPSLEGLLTHNDGPNVFVGETLSHADVAVWDALDAIVGRVAGASLSEFPRVDRFFKTFAARPSVEKYLAERPPN
jgi:glutathione S-transferase